MLEFEVVEVKGYCPLYRVGDKLIIDTPRVVVGKGDHLCKYALSLLMRYVQDLEDGVDPEELGLTKLGGKGYAYVECETPCKYYEKGGSVVFRCRRVAADGRRRRKLSVAVRPENNRKYRKVRC